MKLLVVTCIASMLAIVTATASALPGTFLIDEIYSNADGTVQFVVIRDRGGADCDANENFWAGETLVSLGAEPKRTFVFPANLPTCQTSGKRILIATEGFAALGLVTPDYVIPNGFLQRPSGTLVFSDVSSVAYTALPSDGVTAIDATGAPIPNVATNLAGATASVTGATSKFSLNQHGLTGSWFEAATAGQGVEVEIFPDVVAPGTGLVQVSWFTFDAAAGGADHQRWYTLGGTVVGGQPSVALTIYRNIGGNFAAPPTTSGAAVGTATLAFDSCTSGSLAYAFTDGSGRAGSIPLRRLTQNVTCDAGGARPTNADFALSGNWFDPATSGQGITIEANPVSGVLFLAWYTYAKNGAGGGVAGQRWYTALGSFTPGARSVGVQLSETTGGVFDASPPAPVSAAVGTATIAFHGCSALTLTYTFTGGSLNGTSGSMNLTRVGPVPAGCVS
jgi:hypothetical protein